METIIGFKKIIVKVAGGWQCIFLLLIVAVTGCNSNVDVNHANNPSIKTGAATSYKFALQLKAGARYYYTLTNQTITKLELDNRKIITSNNAIIGLLYEVIKAGTDTSLVKLTYDKMHIVLKNDDDKQVIDADNTGDEASILDQVMGNIKGSSLLVTLLKDGTIIKVDGTEEINTKVLTGLRYMDDNTRAQVTVQLSKIVGGDFVKNNVGQAVNFYPDSAITSGATWVRKSTQPGELNFDAITTYTLTDLEDGLATIESKSTLNTSNGTMELGGKKVNAAMKGTTTGSFEAAIATGMVTKGSSSASLEGTIQVLSRVVPLTITIKRELTTKQL